MPANLSPEYKHADEAYRAAKTDAERIACLEEMLACIPKHKGTEKMQADLKTRMAKLREHPTGHAGARQRDIFHVEPGGAGQVVLLGLPNCGKSALVGKLSNAKVTVTDYPFGTHGPVPGMTHHEDVPIQLVDMPPVTPDSVVPGMMGTYRNADIILIAVDLAAPDTLEQLEGCLEVLQDRNMLLVARRTGRDERDAEGHQLKTAVIVGTKDDVPGAADTFETLRELYGSAGASPSQDGSAGASPSQEGSAGASPSQGERVPMFSVSANTGHNLTDLLAHLFRTLDVIRVYCKEPGKPPDMNVPFILPRGSTIMDMATAGHREFPERLKHACVWGSAKFPGQQVQRDHVLADRDIVELHLTG